MSAHYIKLDSRTTRWRCFSCRRADSRWD